MTRNLSVVWNAIEQGKYSPSLEAAFRIAQVFGLPLERVFHYHPD